MSDGVNRDLESTVNWMLGVAAAWVVAALWWLLRL